MKFHFDARLFERRKFSLMRLQALGFIHISEEKPQ
jgi:hypothetical protein